MLRRLSITLALIAAGCMALLIALVRSRDFQASLQDYIRVVAAEQLGLRVELTRWRLEYFPWTLHLEGVRARPMGGESLVSMDALRVRMRDLGVNDGVIRLRSLVLERPRLTLRIVDGRPVNVPRALLSGLDDPEARPATPPPELAGGGSLIVDRVELSGGQLVLETDREIGARVSGLNVVLARHSAAMILAQLELEAGEVRTPRLATRIHKTALEATLSSHAHPTDPDAPPRRDLDVTQLTLNATADLPPVAGHEDSQAVQLSLSLKGLLQDIEGERRMKKVSVQARAPIALAWAALPEMLPEMSGELALTATAGGTLRDPRVRFKLDVDDARVVDRYERDGEKLEDLWVPGSWDIEGELTRSALYLNRMHTEGERGIIDVEGELHFDPQMTLRAEGKYENAKLHRLLEDLTLPGAWVTFTGNGDFSAEGHLFDEAGEADFQITGKAGVDVIDFALRSHAWNHSPKGPTIIDFPRGRVDTKFLIDAEAFSFEDCWISLPGGSRMSAKARLNFDLSKGMDIRGVSEQFDLDAFGHIAQLPIRGVGKLQGRVKGPYSRQVVITGRAELDDSLFYAHELGRAEFDVRYSQGKLAFEDILGRYRRSRYEADGLVDFNKTPLGVDWTGHKVKGRIEDVLVMLGPLRSKVLPRLLERDAKGKLSGEGRLWGNVDDFDLDLELELSDTKLAWQTYEQVQAKVRLEDGAVLIDRVDATVAGKAKLSAEGKLEPNGRMRFLAQSEGLRLEMLDVVQESGVPVQSDLEIAVEVQGATRRIEALGRIALDNTVVRGLPVDSSRADLEIDAEQMRLEGSLLGGEVGLEAGAFLAGQFPYWMALSMQDAELGRLLPEDDAEPEPTPAQQGAAPAPVKSEDPVAITVTGNVSARGSLQDLKTSKGRIEMSSVKLQLPSDLDGDAASDVFATDALHVALSEKGFEVEKGHFLGPNTEVELSGGGDADGELALLLTGRMDAAIVSALSKEWVAAEGRFDVEIAVGGSLRSPTWLGKARVDIPTLRSKLIEEPITDVSGLLSLAPRRIVVEELVGELGGGRLRSKGEIGLDRFRPRGLNVRSQVERVRIRYPVDWPSTISGDLLLTREYPELPLLSGELDVHTARYSKNIQILGKAVDALRGAPDHFQIFDREREVLRFDVGLHADDAVFVKNNLADMEMAAEVRVTGTNQRLGLIGEVEALRGTAAVDDHLYKIVQARVSFLDRNAIRYEFDATGSTRVRGPRPEQVQRGQDIDLDENTGDLDCEITVRAFGSLEKFQTRLWSDGPDSACNSLTQDQLINWLILGAPVAAAEGDAPISRAYNVGLNVIWRTTGIEQEIRRLLPGTSRLRPIMRDTLSSPTPVLGVSFEWSPFANLNLGLETSLDQRYADPNFRVEYQLTRHSSLVGAVENQTRSQVADFGLDLRLRWEH